MLKNKMNIICIMLLFQLVPAGWLSAQTIKWDLEWQPNSENDVYLYRVFRGENPQPTTQIDSISHPHTSFTDDQVEKGVLYYYRLKAVDFSLNSSSYSDEISAAIPKIQGLASSMELTAGSILSFFLDTLVVDPDHAAAEIEWEINTASTLQVTLDTQSRILNITAPANWNSSEFLKIIAGDPDGFSDALSFRVYAPGFSQGIAPVFSTIPGQQIDEDQSSRINLLDFVEDSDSPSENLVFSAVESDHLSLKIDKHDLTITPDADWFGDAVVSVNVRDEMGLLDSSRINITVHPVNDAPVLKDLPAINLEQGSSVDLDLSQLASDVDDPQSELIWQFGGGLSRLTIDYDSQNQSIEISSPEDWFGFEYVQVVVRDPQGAESRGTMTIRVSDNSGPPQIDAVPNIVFDEDTSFELPLNEYAADAVYPPENLLWRVSGNRHVIATIDHEQNSASFSSKENWNGKENIWLVVTNPNQKADSTNISVTVQQINDAPRFAPLPNFDLSEIRTASLNLKNYVSDVDSPPESWLWSYDSNGPVTVTISAAGTAAIEAPADWNGQQAIRVMVRDEYHAADSSTVLVYSQDMQSSPKINLPDTLVIFEDNQRQLDLSEYVSDSDHPAEQLSWEIFDENNIAASISDQNLQLLLTPQPDWFGEEKIAFRAQDPDGQIDFDTVHVFVRAVNDIPRFNQPGTILLFGGTVYTMDLHQVIIEPDGFDDLLSIDIIAAQDGFIGYHLDQQQGELHLLAPLGYSGSERFNLRVTDSAGEEAGISFIAEAIASNISGSVQVDFFGSPTNILLSWQSINLSQDYVEFGEDLSYGLESSPEKSLSLDHQIRLNNLQPEQDYHFRIISKDANGKTIVSQDSVFTTGRASRSVIAFPVPYRPNSEDGEDGIYFSNLEQGFEVLILNLMGELVFRTRVDDSVYRWDVKNKYRQDLASGLFLYRVKDEKGKQVSKGKIIIVR